MIEKYFSNVDSSDTMDLMIMGKMLPILLPERVEAFFKEANRIINKKNGPVLGTSLLIYELVEVFRDLALPDPLKFIAAFDMDHPEPFGHGLLVVESITQGFVPDNSIYCLAKIGEDLFKLDWWIGEKITVKIKNLLPRPFAFVSRKW